MTINTIDGNIANCNWFDKTEGLLIAHFSLQGLTKDKPEE